MPHPIEASILRILNSKDKTVGTGFLVAPDLAVTCAHVALDALGRVGSVAGETLRIQFSGQTRILNALVLSEFWHDVDREDIAILRLNEVPDGILPLPMERAGACKLDSPLYTFGYAKAADEDKIGGSGVFITLPQGSKVFQFRMEEADHGHSGAPVWDVRRGVVIGMIQKGNRGPEGKISDTSFAIPVESIWEVCPQLRPPMPVLPKRSPLLDGINLLPYDYDQRIQNFLTEYLGSEGYPVPFGGRNEAIAMLNAWLDSNTSCLLLAAPAGRGKSALLVRWLEILKERADLAVAFVPVSIRFGTNMERVFYAALAARLALLHGEDIPTSPETSTTVYRGLVSDYLSKPLSSGRTLLVMLDGLDEAADWQVGPNFIPSKLPYGVKVVVSARYLAGDTDSVPWLRRLSWERKGLASTPLLAPLDRVGVADVLLKMGCPLDELSRNVDIVSELYRLSEGDPLLVSFYVGDLWAKGDTVTLLKPEDLSDIQPGYKGYFDRWWNDQKKLWGKEKPWLETHIWYVRNLLAGALGPLFTSDIQALYPELASNYIEDALEALKRFIIGDNQIQGYTFSHPKLEQYFWETLTPTEQDDVENRFLDWGEKTFQEFIDRKRDTQKRKEIPVYVVRNYGAHLARAEQPVEKWLPLIYHQEWAKAWFTVEGAYGGYLQDIQRAWGKFRLIDQLAIDTTNIVPYLAQETRCILIETSLHSLASNVTPDLLSSLIKNQIWTVAQGLAYIRQIPNSKQRAQSLLGIMPYLPADYFGSFILILQEIHNEVLRVAVLKKLVEWLPENLFGNIISMIKSIKSEEYQSDILILAADRIPENLLDNVLEIAQSIPEGVNKASALGKLAHRFPVKQQYSLYVEALTLADQLKNENDSIKVLELFTREIVDNLLSKVLSMLRKRKVWTRVHVYSLLIPRSSEPLLDEAILCLYQSDINSSELRKEELNKLFKLVPLQKIEDYRRLLYDSNKEFKTELLREINQYIIASHTNHTEAAPVVAGKGIAKRRDDNINGSVQGEKTLIEDLSKSLLINDSPYLKYFYSSISNFMPLTFSEQLIMDVAESLSAKDKESKRYLHSIYNTDSVSTSQTRLQRVIYERPEEKQSILTEVENLNLQVNILRELIRKTSKLQHNRLSDEILSTVLVAPMFQRNYLLNEIALYGDDNDLGQVQSLLTELDVWDHVSILTTLATRLSEDRLKSILNMAKVVPETAGRANILKILAMRLPEEDLSELLAATKCLGDENDRTQVVLEITKRIPETHLSDVFLVANECWYSANTALILIGLSERYPNERTDMLREATEIAGDIRDKLNRLYVLTELAYLLPEELKGNVANEALQILLEINVNERFAITKYGDGQAISDAKPNLGISNATKKDKGNPDSIEGLDSIADDLVLENNLRDQWITWSNKSFFAITTRLMDVLSDTQQDMVLNSALKKAREIGNENYRARILCEIAEKSSARTAGEILMLAEEIESGWHRAQVLAVLTKHFTGE